MSYQALVVLALGAGLCGAPETPARQLTTSELKSLFVGHYLKRGELVAPYPTLDFSEHFRENGEYLLIDHGSSDTGTYDIRNDAVCLKLYKTAEACRHVFKDDKGRIWIRDPRTSEKPILINLFKEAQ